MSKFSKNYKNLPGYVQQRCNEVLSAVESGTNLRELKAKFIERFKGGERKARVELGAGYRLVLLVSKRGLSPDWVGPHREYEKWLAK
jgi:hypothetical protein